MVDLGQKLFGLIVEIVLEVVAEDQVHDRGLSGGKKAREVRNASKQTSKGKEKKHT